MLNSPDAREDDKLNGYNGDVAAWFNDCIRFDTLRPIRAAALIDVTTENNVEVPAIVETFGTYEQAERFCEQWGWSFDDCFTSYKGLFVSPELWIDDLTNPILGDVFYCESGNWYDSKFFEPYLYGDN